MLGVYSRILTPSHNRNLYLYLMRFLVLLAVFVNTLAFAQNEVIAKNYFDNGAYKKALIEYKKLYSQSPSNINYIDYIIKTHQELEQYDDAEVFLSRLLERIHYPAFMVALGYNYQLKGEPENAQRYYLKALSSIDNTVTHVFAVARSFKKYTLLNEATSAYKKAMALNPELNFNLQLAQIYGEQGHIEKMLVSYLNFAETNPRNLNDIKRTIADFISADNQHATNVLFRKLLLKKIQQQPDLIWNELLSWLFIQQKEFGKAFQQEKAIFKRSHESLNRMIELALIASKDNQNTLAKDIFKFVIKTAQDTETQLQAHSNVLEIDTKTAAKTNYPDIKDTYLALLKTYGKQQQTLSLQIAYAHFLGFYMNRPDEASAFLENTLKLPLTKLEKASVKLELGDLLVLQEKFNQALIYYTQIQRGLKNSVLSQEARFRVAKTSYFKGDFNWAEAQLKILKGSTSQLIANDALDLKLLISDNKYEDSLHTALKYYAKADLLAFQNQTSDAIEVLENILTQHQTEPIRAQALYKQAQLFESQGANKKAATNYEAIIEDYKDSVLADDACFRLAVLYEKSLNLAAKAQELYQYIIYNHADSIYFVDARKQYRKLRGDTIN